MEVRDQILGRMYAVLTLLGIFVLCVGIQMAWIHLSHGEELREMGFRQARTVSVLPARRGAIMDRAGRVFVVNSSRYELAVDPSFPGFTEVRSEFFEELSRLTGQQPRAYHSMVDGADPESRFVPIATLSERQYQEVTVLDVPGVILRQEFRRRYNYGSTAAHILGHVNKDGEGIAGLELQYDEFLQGVQGRRALLRDRRGYRRVDAAGTVVQPQDGESLVLTIDLVRQTIMEEELARGVEETGSLRGIAIAVDPHTGAILAIANSPTYDPNSPQHYQSESWRNYAITDVMEPGSTFKLVGAAAALERGVTSMTRNIDTGNGTLVIHGRTLHDTEAHGRISFSDVITLSSNVGMAKVAMKLQQGDLYQYARNFGFGQKTWVDMPGEVSGLLKKTSRWSGTTLTSMSIGYEVNVTALQLLMAYSALANGGLLRQPYIVAERRDIMGRTLWHAATDVTRRDSVRRVLDEETARQLLPAFTDVVIRGTAKKAQVENLAIAGKTGTARKVKGGYYSRTYRGTFVGFFPADDPRVAMIVVMDEPKTSIYGGAVSAPVFKRIAERWVGTFPVLAMNIATPTPLPDEQVRTVPDVTNYPAMNAARHLRSIGYSVAATDDPLHFVAEQHPAPGTLREPGSHVWLSLDSADSLEVSLPDMTGFSARSAMAWLMGHGVQVHLRGHGRVVSQSVEAGVPLPAEVILYLE